MSNDMTCEKLREIGAELALGILPGRERAAAVAHLDRCADCREYVEQLTLVGDGLIGLLPGCAQTPRYGSRSLYPTGGQLGQRCCHSSVKAACP
ncbi:hypothetical protein ABZ504_43020, partial [Streptomyces mirabilis]